MGVEPSAQSRGNTHQGPRGLRLLAQVWNAAIAVVTRTRWSRIGIVLSACIIGVSLAILWHRLQHIDLHHVMTALAGKPVRDIVFAALAITASYATLTFYDWFALRTIGARHVPYRTAALASFTGYSIGHNIGATVFTGGAIRYRIYSFWGLRVLDIAKLCFVTGLTFWLGNLTVLGLGLVYVPSAASAVDHLAPWINRTVGITALVVIFTYVLYVWQKPRVVGMQRWQVTLPNGPLTLVQIGIGLTDLLLCAFAVSLLIPAQPPIDFMALSVIFVFATLFGFASHAPGSLGVFDAAMLVGLGQFNREELVAGLLLFRLLYFIIPFTLALTSIGIREAWLATAKAEPVARPQEWP
jgi:glycosyltransferase 2 family protein